MRFNPDTNPNERLAIGDSAAIRSKEILSAIRVKNEVLWVNSKVCAPFRLEKGKSAQLGIFLTNDAIEQETYPLEIISHHYRSAMVGQIIFEDKDGRLYRDVDLKGAGGVSLNRDDASRFHVDSLIPQQYRFRGARDTPYGICDLEYAITDRKMSEFFVKKGLRTHRALAFIKLNEIVVEHGKKISINDAYRLHYIPKDIEPIIEVRAFGTKARIANAYESGRLRDAKTMVAQELGKNPKDFTNQEYLTWFAVTLGEQVAIIHSAGYWHKYLSDHNITLDCRIVDLDSVDNLPKAASDMKRDAKVDLSNAKKSLTNLLYHFFDLEDFKRNELEEGFKKLFVQSYFGHLINPKLKKLMEDVEQKQ